jgi:hypothetical protein
MMAEVSHQNGKAAGWLNRRHEMFAWISLLWIMFADFYVRMVSMGLITDLNTWG